MLHGIVHRNHADDEEAMTLWRLRARLYTKNKNKNCVHHYQLCTFKSTYVVTVSTYQYDSRAENEDLLVMSYTNIKQSASLGGSVD